MLDTDELRAALFNCIVEARRERGAELLDLAAAKLGRRRAIQEVLEPVLLDVGERWSADKLSLAQGYVAGKIAEDVLARIAPDDVPAAATGPHGVVVLGNIEDDYHALGRRMVGTFLRAAGWDLVDLGNDVSAQAFVDAAQEHGALVVGVSAMMLSTAENIRSVRRELDRRGLGGSIQLAVGGAIFKLRPELVHEVGGDGTAASAIQAPALIETLWARARKIREEGA